MPEVTKIIISVAFLNQRGFAPISDLIKPNADKAVVLAGIRNGITSAQGLIACIECGCKTYAVDTGSKHILFHPKIYFGKNANQAQLVLGSANLTVGGLSSNVEAGLKIDIDLNVPEDASFATDLEAKINSIITEYPDHVFEVTSENRINELLNAGRLIDESVTSFQSPSGSSSNRDLDPVPTMELKTEKLKFTRVLPIKNKLDVQSLDEIFKRDVRVATKSESSETSSTKHAKLVWRSKPLKRRPLTIPNAENTNQTGSMGFTKGLNPEIDQRHYFREEVFNELDWQADTAPDKEHLERAEANFHIVIKGLSYGDFKLSLTHDTRTESLTYIQNNSVTQLRWGKIRELVAREDLLDRTMYLYKISNQSDLFILEID